MRVPLARPSPLRPTRGGMRKFVLSRGTSGKTHSGSAAVCFERLRPRAARERVSLTCVSRLFFLEWRYPLLARR